MPELPEVEHIANWLRPQLVGRKITEVVVFPGSERCIPQGEHLFRSRVIDARIGGVRRRGKLILLQLQNQTLAIHLKMTGQLWLEISALRAHTRVSLGMGDGLTLSLVDMRKFGWLQVWSSEALADWEKKQGPEPLPKLPPGWETTLQSRRSIKAVLLDQKVIAGIGNIFADEILFRARLAPTRPAVSLSKDERARLRDAVEQEMQAAVDERVGEPDQKRVGGGDRSVKALFHWKVFQRDNEPCSRCGRRITRSVVAGRGTYFCSECQT